MRLSDRYDGSDSPFEGDLTLVWRSLPANARVLKANVKLKPRQSPTGEMFEEIITFTGGQGDWGATKTTGTGFVEVDFHKRRTLARVTGTGTASANLQVDVGSGVYVEINAKGALRTPGDGLFPVPADGKLPGLLVTKFKLTAAAGASPNISQITIRSAPTNVSVRLGNLPPFWTHLGELTRESASPDFAAILQTFLAEAKAENGFYQIPLIVHSDAIARLKVGLEVEYLVEVSAMPPGLDEVQLPYDFGSLPKAQENVLQLVVPSNTRVAPKGVTAQVRGAFEETRIVFGPTGAVTPAGTVEISPTIPQAQMISLAETLKAAAFDLYMVVSQAAKLELDLREDLDGKPGSLSLLPGAVRFELSAPVGAVQDRKTAGEVRWISVALPAEFQFQKDRRYWLVIQGLEGQVAWSVEAVAAGSVGMQHTKDGGLSWRETTVAGVSGPVSAFFRLRQKPERFEMPVELQVGKGEQAIRVSLDRFQPLGRVDFALDFNELAEAFNQYLTKATPSRCPETEHLANGDFEDWLTVGDTLDEAKLIILANEPSAIAISPNGRAVLVGVDDGMQLMDVACNTVLERFDIPGVPRGIAFHPQGGLAYTIASGNLLVIDADAHRQLGSSLGLIGEANALAVSSDGKRLYVTEYYYRGGFDGGSIRVIDTQKLEQAVLKGVPQLDEVTIGKPISLSQQKPTALAVSPDGRQLYVTVSQDQKAKGLIRLFETATFEEIVSPLEVGQEPSAIAVTLDGKWAVVANKGENTASLIDAEDLIVAGSIRLDHSPIAIAIAPDGLKAYVAGSGNSISILDLARRSVAGTIIVGAPQKAIALTPQGDRIYVITTQDENNSLKSIQIGMRLPAEWNLTAGRVTPFCLPDPFHLVAVLGIFSQTRQEIGERRVTAMPSALSQTVPVAQACPYEFSFWGIATGSEAVAEVMWIGKDCGLLRTDRVPIQVLERKAAGVEATALARTASVAASRSYLVFHRVRLTAPTGAEQAEVRFHVPEGVVAAIDRVSLIATTEAVANADLSLRQQGRLAGWDLLAGRASGVTMVAVKDGVQLRNVGAETAELVQAIPVKGGQPFDLEFQGRTVTRPAAKDNPRLELRWFKSDHSPAAAPIVLEILPAGFDLALARGVSPSGASEAELYLVVPPGTTLEIKRVSLKFSTSTSVPVSFIAQSPGELTVSNWRVALEQVETAVPQIPEQGLCTPTLPGRRPGETPSDCCFCPCCESEQTLTEITPAKTRAGRPARIGRCASCGTKLVLFGGARIAGAKPLSFPRGV